MTIDTNSGQQVVNRRLPKRKRTVVVPVEERHTLQELKSLLEKAQLLVKGSCFRPAKWLYRNKPPAYYTDIAENNNNVMSVIEKDYGGHPRNPINGQLCGLFFLANVEANLEPRKYSPYGTKRLMVPSEKLLTDVNLYFSDFYCLNLKKPHYVILVVTKPDSKSDEWCRTRLPRLEVNNPFLRLASTEVEEGEIDWELNIECNTGVLVEVFYTENIDLKQFTEEYGSYFCDSISHGTSTPGGVPRNPHCELCALPLPIRTLKHKNKSAM